MVNVCDYVNIMQVIDVSCAYVVESPRLRMIFCSRCFKVFPTVAHVLLNCEYNFHHQFNYVLLMELYVKFSFSTFSPYKKILVLCEKLLSEF